MKQVIIGLVIGIIGLRLINIWLTANTSSSSSVNQKQKTYVDQLTSDDIEIGVGINEKLARFNDDVMNKWYGEGTLEIEQVADGVYVAHKYSLANVVIIEGPERLIVVDTSESPKTAALILSTLRQITTKPIEAIVLTHHHADHITGIESFIEDSSNPPDIWAHHTLPDNVIDLLPVNQHRFRGAVHQFGLGLSGKSGMVYPRFPNGVQVVPLRLPNRLIRGEVEHAFVAGLNVTFIHAPGETDDQIVIWLPDKRVLISADNILKMFPNIYAIRGTPHRDPLVWARTLRKMRALGAEYLVPCHGASVEGQQKIHDILTAYSSAIQFVHDQTVRRVNELKHPDEIGRLVRLPTSLAEHPNLGEFYGFVEWSVKAVYQQYAGWFSGDVAEMLPLTPSERAQSLVDWLGVDRILDEAESSLHSGKTQWSLELSGHVRRVQPDNLRARWLWTHALRIRASEQVNQLARNYFLTAALDSNGLVDWKVDRSKARIDMDVLLGLMKYRLKAELTDGVNSSVYLHFTDSGSHYHLQIVYSVLEVELLSSAAATAIDLSSVTYVRTTESVWSDILLGKTKAFTAYMSGGVEVTGSLLDVTDGVYLAQKNSLANVVILEGPEHLIIIDTSESPKTADKILSALRQITQKPIKAIVLTHHHTDHINGIESFVEDLSNPPDIWSHYLLPDNVKDNYKMMSAKRYRGAVHQFGFALSGKSGIAFPPFPNGYKMGALARLPNRLIREEVEQVECLKQI